jgi:hypothetical protein
MPDVSTALGLLGGIALMVAIMVLGWRHFTRNRDAYNQAAERHNATLEQLARARGWSWHPGADYSHSMIGTYRGWGTACGTEQGLAVEVAMEHDSGGDGPAVITTVILLKPPAGRAFRVGDGKRLTLVRKKGTLDRRGRSPVSVAELDPLVSRLEVTPQLLRATLAPPAHFFRSLSYQLGAQPDSGIVSAAVAASVRAAWALLGP